MASSVERTIVEMEWTMDHIPMDYIRTLQYIEWIAAGVSLESVSVRNAMDMVSSCQSSEFGKEQSAEYGE